MCHLHSRPQHEAMRCRKVRVPHGASITGDPRKGGSPETWLSKTNCSTCILDFDMRRRIATQYVSNTAQLRGSPESWLRKNKLFRLQAGAQHETTHCHSIRFPYGASTTGDPRTGGSPENWLRKANCFTCILGLNMRRCIATQYVFHTAQAHQVTHEGVGHQKTG